MLSYRSNNTQSSIINKHNVRVGLEVNKWCFLFEVDNNYLILLTYSYDLIFLYFLRVYKLTERVKMPGSQGVNQKSIIPAEEKRQESPGFLVIIMQAMKIIRRVRVAEYLLEPCAS